MRSNALALILTTLAGCAGSCNPTPDGTPTDGATPADGQVVLLPPETDLATHQAPLQATLRATGPVGGAPRHVLIQLNRAIFEESTVGQEPTGLTFAVEPPVAGTLRIAATDLVEFTPATGLPPGGSWTATLTSVTVGDQTTTPEKPWTLAFAAPKFELTSARLQARDASNGNVVIELSFGGEVSVDAVKSRLKLSADGADVPVHKLYQSEPYAISVEARLPAKDKDQALSVVLGEGVPWLGDASVTAPATTKVVPLPRGPEVRILAATLREGASGFYVEVVCDDDASDGERYWWDRVNYDSYWVSTRCQLDDTHAEHFVTTNPGTELSFAPGPAGFRVFGNFGRGALEIKIDAGAPTVDGGEIRTAGKYTFQVPARSTQLSFTSRGRYLPRSSWKNLGIQHLNADSIGLSVRHVPERNLVFWLTGDEPTTERTSDLVLNTAVAVQNPPDAMQTSWLPVGELVADPQPGVYEITATAGGRSTSSRLLLTDMHLVAKANKPQPGQDFIPSLKVWALDVHDASALDGVDVKLVRASGKVLGSCSTSGDRGCDLTVNDDDDPSPPVALIARRGKDLTYVELADLRLDTPDDTQGVPYATSQPFQSPLYTDRGVYRPGDTAHLAGVVRNQGFVAPEAGLPVVVKLFDPKGREIKKRVLQTNPAGMFATDFAFGDYQITGHYRATAEIGDLPAGAVEFQVEEFVPERLKVTAGSDVAHALLGEAVPIEVTGEWLFGGAVKQARVELSCTLEPHAFRPPGHDGFAFGPAWLSGKPQALTLGMIEGSTDDEGKVTLECPAPEGGASLGPAQLVAQAAVFEGESGRTTIANTSVPVHPSKTYVGLDTSAEKAEAGKAFDVQGRVVDWEGKPTGGGTELTVEVYRMEEEFSWWWEEEGGSQERQLRPARETRDTVTVDDQGRFTWKVTPQIDSAGTMVRVRGRDTLTELFVEGTAQRYYWEEGSQSVDSTPRPARPAQLTIDLPERIPVGKVVDVATMAPYGGRILWTVETDGVLDAVWLDALPGRNAWRFKVDQFTPNVYVSALLVKDPHLESAAAFLPDRAFGVRSVEIIPEAFEQEVTLTAPSEVQPYSPLEVVVDVGAGQGPTYATIAVVDEGILQLTRFKDPDPLGEIFRQRALGVSSYETIGWTLLHDPRGPSSTTGGDGDGGGGRVQMVKPVALWSGMLEADAQGKATATFDIPGYRGRVRVMVVTASSGRVGTASQEVLVRDPLVLQTTLPRFLLTGDTAEIPVMVANLSGKPQDVTIALTATNLVRGAIPDVSDGSPPVPVLKFLGEPTGRLQLGVDESKTAVFQVRTRDIPGAATLEVTAKAGALVSRETLDIPIQAASSELREVRRRALDGGTNVLLADYDGWLEGTDRTTLWVTSNPYAHAMSHLRFLVRYPFG